MIKLEDLANEIPWEILLLLSAEPKYEVDDAALLAVFPEKYEGQLKRLIQNATDAEVLCNMIRKRFPGSQNYRVYRRLPDQPRHKVIIPILGEYDSMAEADLITQWEIWTVNYWDRKLQLKKKLESSSLPFS